MTLFSLRWKFCLLCCLLALSAYCEKQPSNRTYNVCSFVREGQRCDFKKFDSSGDEPCIIGRKAGLTRINGVKVGHIEDVDLGDIVRKRRTSAMKPLLFEIPNFLSDEECDHMIDLAERERFVTSTAKGGLQSWSEFEIPDIRNGPLHVDYFQYLDRDKNGKITIEESDLLAGMFVYLLACLQPRYSDQTWVNQRALDDPVLNKVIERVVELTRLSREIIYGSERIQIVRYGKHGHYHAHFDSETDKRTDKRCCQLHEDVVQAFNKDEGCRLCRYITILFYLNDVEEGGETAFPMADNVTLSMEYLTSSRGDVDYFNLSHNCHQGLAISPRKGTAIMWYNHLLDDESGWMGARDDFSLHGGCDIKKGEKWIANLWITAPYKDGAHIPSSWLRKFDVI
ncbi:Transmembrane prolyl 4-hydroxylase [Stylophora pistillata]|uniref:Transmembrane prolyl 4-hydroxylase n=1 Tax=Stylophora pistillata TaxID=50429 RepID=A0A2B4SQN6_STYPI|nr:Transmembrane prolyl 4-hydroxylase [Stylophora pistillata]